MLQSDADKRGPRLSLHARVNGRNPKQVLWIIKSTWYSREFAHSDLSETIVEVVSEHTSLALARRALIDQLSYICEEGVNLYTLARTICLDALDDYTMHLRKSG